MKSKVFLLLLLASLATAGTTPLPRAVPGFIKLSYVNNIRSALVGTIVPRNSIGNAGDTAGNIGNGAFRWTLFRGQSIVFANDPGEYFTTLQPAASGQTVDLHLQTLTTLPLGSSILTITPAGHMGYGAPQAGNFAVSLAASGNFTTNNTLCNTFVAGVCTVFSTPINGQAVPNLSVALNTFGHRVHIGLFSARSTYNSYGGSHFSGTVGMDGVGRGGILLQVDGTAINNPMQGIGFTNGAFSMPCSEIQFELSLPAGPHTFDIFAAKTASSDSAINVTDCGVVAYEIF